MLPLAKKPPSPVVQVLPLLIQEKEREFARQMHSQVGKSPCPPDQSLLEEPDAQKSQQPAPSWKAAGISKGRARLERT